MYTISFEPLLSGTPDLGRPRTPPGARSLPPLISRILAPSSTGRTHLRSLTFADGSIPIRVSNRSE
eukprot:1919968-Pyramimonas_sp.AAC.1